VPMPVKYADACRKCRRERDFKWNHFQLTMLRQCDEGSATYVERLLVALKQGEVGIMRSGSRRQLEEHHAFVRP